MALLLEKAGSADLAVPMITGRIFSRWKVSASKGRSPSSTFVAAVDLSGSDGMERLLAMRTGLHDLQPLCRVIEALFALLAAELGAPELPLGDRPIADLAAPALYQFVTKDVIGGFPISLAFKARTFSAAIHAPGVRLGRHDIAAPDAAMLQIQRVADLTARSSSISFILDMWLFQDVLHFALQNLRCPSGKGP